MISIPVFSTGSSIPEPAGWMQPVLYWNLDNLDGLTLMEGTEVASFNALVPGKVRKLF